MCVLQEEGLRFVHYPAWTWTVPAHGGAQYGLCVQWKLWKPHALCSVSCRLPRKDAITPHCTGLPTSSLSFKFRWLSPRLQTSTHISRHHKAFPPDSVHIKWPHSGACGRALSHRDFQPYCIGLGPSSSQSSYFSQARCVCVNLQVGPSRTED